MLPIAPQPKLGATILTRPTRKHSIPPGALLEKSQTIARTPLGAETRADWSLRPFPWRVHGRAHVASGTHGPPAGGGDAASAADARTSRPATSSRGRRVKLSSPNRNSSAMRRSTSTRMRAILQTTRGERRGRQGRARDGATKPQRREGRHQRRHSAATRGAARRKEGSAPW